MVTFRDLNEENKQPVEYALLPGTLSINGEPIDTKLTEKDTNPKDALGMAKLPIHLFPQTATIAGAMAFLEGAAKYGKYNYRIAGVRASVYIDALERHLFAWTNGEDIDPESGLPHLWKMLACIAVLIDADACGKMTDDRPPRAPVAKIMKDCVPLIAEVKERYKDKNPHQYTIEDGE